MSERIAGSCLCKKVRFSVANQFKRFYLCHCTQCQKITGSAHAANLFTSPDNIQWTEREQFITRFVHPSRDFSTAFCACCGCGLPFVTKSGRALIVPAGSLDQQPALVPNENIFWSERVSWYEAGLQARHCAGFPD